MPTPLEFFHQYQARSEQRIPHRIVGLMSGTSLDGVDAALVDISGTGRGVEVNLVAFHTHPFPAILRRQVLRLSQGDGNPALISEVNVTLGNLFADAAETVTKGQVVHAIASHGQTVSHTPDTQATLQIGDPAVMATRLNVPVVSHFRGADMAVGGQGAPLIPYADWCLLTHQGEARAVQNIGGIGNVTYLPPNANSSDVLGFDTGPGNMLIDHATVWASYGEQKYDENGGRASRGTVQIDLLKRLLAHPFLLQRPPKSAGREQFGEVFFDRLVEESKISRLKGNDLVATLTAFTAYSIAQSYQNFLPALPDEIWLGGGGAHNAMLRFFLSEALPNIPLRTHQTIPADAREAVAFALLAHETLQGVPSNLPSVTGASRPVLLGSVTFP
jgi:anhydro-N-acetylmuramic acid kinase